MLVRQISAVASALLATCFVKGVEAADLPAIEIKGNKFFYSNNGTQFFMRGIAYQADSADAAADTKFNDPLGDYSICSRDIPYLQKLQTNVIRVYALDSKLDHTKCMKALNDAGIYVIADLSEPSISIKRDKPEWDLELYQRYTSIVDEMQAFSNVLGFFAGNEVTNDNTNTDASAFVKAAVRDTKAYIKAKGYRKIPVGYSSNDDEPTRDQITDYFACGSEEERADFFGINMYEWCGDSTFKESGFADRTKEFSRLSIPAFFSEYGCNEIRPRKFSEVAALYSKDMTDVWSGGIVYMYFEEDNEYGLVKVDSNGKVSTLPDFDNYSTQIAKVNPTGVNSKDYTPKASSMSCPDQDKDWKAAKNLPPTPYEDACKCMSGSLSCVVKDSVDEEDYGKLFGFLCSEVSCGGISANGTTGDYGGYSFCSNKDRLSFVMDLYYKKNGKSERACNFDGAATLRKSPAVESKCSGILTSMGSMGLGTVSPTAFPTPTGSPMKNGGSGSASGSTAASAEKSVTTASGANNASGPSNKVSSSFLALFGLVTVGFLLG